MITSQIYSVHPALREFIHNITIYSADFTQSTNVHNKYLFVPTYQRYMMFYVEDPIRVLRADDECYITKTASLIVGPMGKAVTLDFGTRHLAIGVAFKPGGLFRLLNIPLSEMYEQDFDTQLLLGREIDDTNCRLRETSCWNEMRRIVEKFLLDRLSRLKPILPIDMAMNDLLNSAGNTPIEKIANDACLSLRQFERKCIEREGMPPKRFARLIRFCRAYRLKELNPTASWTKIAHDCGYYDQMHLIRDFKTFANTTPSGLSREDLLSTIRLHSLMDE
jgi:AraC-like DNA-binding protein